MPARTRESTVALPERGSNVLPRYEPPAFSLTPAAQRQLATLANSSGLRQLDEHLTAAHAAVTNVAGDVNDRVSQKEIAIKRQKRRRQQPPSSQASNNASDDIEQSLDELRDKVQRMTQRMDESMRKIIDGQHSLQFMRDALTAAADDARANASTQASTQTRSQRRRNESEGGDGDSMDEDYEDPTPPDATDRTQTPQTTIETFRSKMDNAKTRYQSHSLTARYAENTEYANFRRVVHDARHPEDDVPIPHPSEWFQEGKAPAPGVTTRAAGANADDDDSDDDIAVSRATISTKCPLTLQEFKEPLSSKKCPHSFESAAILDILQHSAVRLGGHPGGPRGAMVGGEPAVQCPVPGCGEMLSRPDLHVDAVLLRKIKRIQRAKELEEEEADEDGDGSGNRSQNATFIEDDGDDDDAAADDDGADVDVLIEKQKQAKMKKEGASSAPPPRPTQPPPMSSAVVDLDNSDEDDEEEEEDDLDGDTVVE